MITATHYVALSLVHDKCESCGWYAWCQLVWRLVVFTQPQATQPLDAFVGAVQHVIAFFTTV